MEKKYKRILTISHNSFSKKLNNGKTLESILADYEKEELAQLFFSENENPDFDFCDNYFKITDIDVLKNIFLKGKYGSRLRKCEVNNSKTNVLNSRFKKYIWSVLQRISSHITIFRDLLWNSSSWKTKSLFDWVEEFNPSAILYCGGNLGFSHSVALEIKKKYNIPLIVYFTDDYLIYPKNRNVLDYIQKKRINIFYKKTIKYSSLCFAIGDQMCEEYSKYFQREFYPIMNSVPIKPFINKEKKNTILQITYFGGLHLERWKMIGLLGQIINEINQTSQIKSEIKVFTNTSISSEIKKCFNNNNIVYGGSLQGDELIKKMNATDILLHVESTDKYYRSITRLSISTKIPEYLQTGNCILAFGPLELSSIKLIETNNIGVVIDGNAKHGDIKNKLTYLIETPEFRQSIGMNGYLYSKNNFDAVEIRKNFMNKINNI